MALFDTVHFPYGATTAPYSPSHPHRGNDYAAGEGSPLIVCDTQIGLVGSTGLADGPHVHVQAGRDEYAQTTIDPTPYTNQPGTVVKTGTGSEWGNYVCVRVGDVNVFYCHLSRIDVAAGHVIKGGNQMNQSSAEKFVSNAYRASQDIDPTPEQAGYWVARIRDDANKAHELLYALGANDYRGDPLFRHKARNYDKDVAAANGGYVETKVFTPVKK